MRFWCEKLKKHVEVQSLRWPNVNQSVVIKHFVGPSKFEKIEVKNAKVDFFLKGIVISGYVPTFENALHKATSFELRLEK